jgi:hypothetical protein
MSFHFDPLSKNFKPEQILCPKCNEVTHEFFSNSEGLYLCSNPGCKNIFSQSKICIGETPVPQTISYDHIFCGLTGTSLPANFDLDWNQYGGNCNRTFCLSDSLGIFGKPNDQQSITVTEYNPKILTENQPPIQHLNTIRGQLLCTARDGVIYRYHNILEKPEKWKKMDTISCDLISVYDKTIEYSPAFHIDHNKHIFSLTLLKEVLVFRSFHLQDQNMNAIHKQVPPKENKHWLSAPLLIEKNGIPIFVAWQGLFSQSKIIDTELVFFTVKGDEIGSVSTNTVCPPIYNDDLDLFFLFVGNRFKKIQLLQYDLVDERVEFSMKTIDMNIRNEYLHDTSQPLFVLSKTVSNQFEMWGLNKLHRTQEVQICKLIFKKSKESVLFQKHDFKETHIPFEDIKGIAVGVSQLDQSDYYVNQIAFSTLNRGVYVFSKSTTANGLQKIAPVMAIRGDIFGMSIPPIITPAGIVFALSDQVKISEDFGWYIQQKKRRDFAKIESYYYGYGLCILGNRVFVGDQNQVLAFDIITENYLHHTS